MKEREGERKRRRKLNERVGFCSLDVTLLALSRVWPS